MKKIKYSAVTETVTILFIVLFLYTGICKLIDYSVIREQLALTPILEPFATIIARCLPWVEFLAVVLLAIPRWRLKGLYLSGALLVVFTMYISGMLVFDSQLPCSCGGVIELLSWPQHIVLNLVLLVLSVAAIIAEHLNRINTQFRLASIALHPF